MERLWRDYGIMDIMKYKTTIGLEIHAELKTKTKLFCNSKNDPDEIKPNMNICPVCMGHPGTLPVINKEAIKYVLNVGVALGGDIADFTEFDRKNYFYPDIPKGYQISQYKYPLISGGSLLDVDITRVHLEEDTAKSTHETGNYSLIDFNRAGVPLMELVTEPVIESSGQAVKFAKELQLLLRYLGVGDANMEKGEMRVEVNVSLQPQITNDKLQIPNKSQIPNSKNENKLGTKVEVKNLNSFRSVERAIEYEIARQSKLLNNNEKVIQETRGWNEEKQETFSQRIKEGSHDYRYFPEPDLPKFKISEISEFQTKELKKEMTELPWEKRERYKKEFNIKEEDIEFFAQNKLFADFFEKVIKEIGGGGEEIKLASNYIISDVVGNASMSPDKSNKFLSDAAKDFSDLIKMLKNREISSRGAKDILSIMIESGGSPKKIAEDKKLFQKSDEGELKEIIEKVIEENKKVADDYKNGKETALQFLIGQGMRATKGSANPEVLQKLFVEILSD